MSHEPHSGLKTNHTFQIIFYQLKIQVTKTPVRSWTTVLDTTQSTAISIRKKERKKLSDILMNYGVTGSGAKEADDHTAR